MSAHLLSIRAPPAMPLLEKSPAPAAIHPFGGGGTAAANRGNRREWGMATVRGHRSVAKMFRAMQENPGRGAARVSVSATFAEAKIA